MTTSPFGAKGASFDDRRVLVVEDDYFIAEDLKLSLQRAGVEVVGPVSSVAHAMALLTDTARVDGAVLDINLEQDGPVFPIAERLESQGIPLVFATGYDSKAIPARFLHVKRCEKPCSADKLLRELFSA